MDDKHALPRFTDLLKSLPASVPFVGPETQERSRGAPFAARLGANESVFGPSPRAVAAMQAAATQVWKYADPENHALRHALAEHHGVAPANIVVGEGIDGLLGYIARMFVAPGVPVVTSLGAYPTFNYHVAGYGGRLCTVPYLDDREDPAALLECVRIEQAPLVYLANPDNPMGTWHTAETVTDFVDALPAGAVLCLDEAYIEFAPPGTAPALDVSDPRVIRLRTFSKAYGMAGVRVGYAIAHADLAAAFDKVRNHFGVSIIAQAGALAALADQPYLAKVQREVAAARQRIGQIAADCGLATVESATNFVAIDCGVRGRSAREILADLVERGIFVRMPQVAPQDRCIRISAGQPADLDLLAETLPKLL